MKKTIISDTALIPAFVLSAYSGIGLHTAGHYASHEIWHDWAVFHVLASTVFLALGIYHITIHKNWYKGIFRNGLGKKSRITLAVSILFITVSVTGIILLGVEGANSGIGLWHYKIGLLASIFSAIHITSRRKILFNALFHNLHKR